MSLDGLLPWLESTPPAVAVRGGRWTHAFTESAHLLGLAVLVGSIAVVDLRLLGLSRRLPVRALAAHALPWSRAGFGLAAGTGALLFAANATQLAGNAAFQTKLVLIAAAGLNVFVFHTGAFRTAERWEGGRPPAAARAAGAISLGLWTGVIVCGRLIAYI